MKHCVKMLAVIVMCWLWPLPAGAYILEGPHILQLVVDRLGRAGSLFVSQKLILYRLQPPAGTEAGNEGQLAPAEAADGSAWIPQLPAGGAPPKSSVELEESLRYIFAQEAFRSDARSAASERIYVFAAGRSLTIVDGYIVPNAQNRFELYKDVLLYRSRQALSERLMRLGVDVSVSSLGRFEGRIAFVVGADYPDESVPQLWVDKETLLPMRWLIQPARDDSGIGSLEVRYLNWWKIGKTRYPAKVEFYQDGNLVRACRSVDFEENPHFPPELFDIDSLQAVYPRQAPAPADEQNSGQPNEVQKAIEEFQNLFE